MRWTARVCLFDASMFDLLVLWSAWSLCEAYAYQHSYRTRNSDLDVYRAANQMLRVTVDGSAMVLYFEPPDAET